LDKYKQIVSVEAHKGRTIAARLMPGTDLVSGIEAVCQKHLIEYGYFGSVMGSLSKATYIIPQKDLSAPLGFKITDPIETEGPIDLLGGQGVICQSEKGGTMIHLHAQGVTPDRVVFGGHFSHGGNPVLATIDLIIVEFDGARLMRRYDPDSDLMVFSPEL
jgi:hypothetical protein